VPEEDRVLASPADADQLEQLPSDEQAEILDRDESR
jgi:hypothetical protein